MNITSITATPVRIPLAEPLKWATGSIDYADHILVRIMTDEGIEGIAEGIPRPPLYGDTQESMCAMINKYLGPKLAGMDPFNTEQIWEVMQSVYWNLTPKGAIDVALWDIMGKKVGMPCYKLLGGYKTKAAVSWMVGINSLEKMVEESTQKYAQGFRALKLKGGKDADFDIAMFHAIREAVPQDCIVYFDANTGWTYIDAVKVLKACEGLQPYCEEPIAADDDRGRVRLASMVSTPLAGDETCYTLGMVLRQLQLETIGVVNIKIPRSGFTMGKKIVALCEAYNKPILTGTQAESSLGATACLHLACGTKQISLPCENTFYMTVKGSLIKEKPVFENGYMIVPEGPGLGVTLDEDAVKEYTRQL